MANSGGFVVLVVVVDYSVIVTIAVAMVGDVASCGGFFGCWWWFQFRLVVEAKS